MAGAAMAGSLSSRTNRTWRSHGLSVHEQSRQTILPHFAVPKPVLTYDGLLWAFGILNVEGAAMVILRRLKMSFDI